MKVLLLGHKGTDLMFLEYLKTTKLSLIIILPINYHRQYNIDQIEYLKK